MRLFAAVACTLTIVLATPADATLRTIEQAYELTRGQVQLPAGTPGNLTVRPCAGCQPVVLRVTEATTWHSGSGARPPVGQAAILAAFRASATDPDTLVYIYYEPRSLRVKRIVLDGAVPVSVPMPVTAP